MFSHEGALDVSLMLLAASPASSTGVLTSPKHYPAPIAVWPGKGRGANRCRGTSVVDERIRITVAPPASHTDAFGS